jgi:hypothetical protein
MADLGERRAGRARFSQQSKLTYFRGQARDISHKTRMITSKGRLNYGHDVTQWLLHQTHEALNKLENETLKFEDRERKYQMIFNGSQNFYFTV